MRTVGLCFQGLLALAVAGCGGGGGGSVAPADVQVSLSNTTVVEGNSGTSTRALAVSLSEASDQTVSVDYTTVNGTATAGSDYISSSGTLTFAPGQTTEIVSLPVIGDTTTEVNETVVLELSNPMNATLQDDHAVITIQNDDGSTLPRISVADAGVTEGDSGSALVAVNVTLSAASTQDVSVSFATANGTATGGSDYTGTSGTLNFAPGQTSRQFNISILGDTADETNETVLVNLSGAVGATIQDAQAVVTIADNDGAALPTLSIADASVAEGDSGTTTAAMTVSMSTTSNQTVTVAYSTANGTATAGQDYASASGTLTFAPGQTSRVIDIGVTGDTADEGSETVLVNLSSPAGATILDGQAVITIADDDDAALPMLTIADASVAEGDSGTTTAAMTVSMSTTSNQTVTVAYSTANGTATAGQDYASASGTLTFAPGQTSRVINIGVTGDTANEGSETVLVNLSSPVGATILDGQAVLTIADDDTALPTLTIADASVAEGDSGTTTAAMTVSMSTTSNQTVTVAYSTANGTATAGQDYASASGTLTFAPGQTSRVINVGVTGDTADEGSETVLVNLSSPAGATILDGQAVLTITDDDTALPTLSIADASVAEGDSGTTTAAMTVSMSTTSNQTVTVAYSTASGTATAGQDYASASSTLTFAPGQTSRVINVGVTGDTANEGSETVLVNLSSPAGATILDGQAVLTITDDDTAFGLDARPSNPDCVAPVRGSGGGSGGVTVEDAFPASPGFNLPTKILQAPNDASRWYVLQQGGRVRVFNTASPATVSTWLDLTSEVNDERSGGLLGLAFHPDFPGTREVFVSYTGTGSAQESRISRVTLDNATTPVNTTEQILVRVDQSSGTHKGGDIGFGADDSLYISIGDSSENNDPSNWGQNTSRLAGKMLRINVIGTGATYTVPASNPFSSSAHCGMASNAHTCPEIYAFGFRNPWRWSFDPQSSVLWVADVGEKAWEEIDQVELGKNYGWSCREGTDVFNASRCVSPAPVDPVYEYDNGTNGNISITGGFVYRGTDIPALAGRYVFGDFGSGRIWALRNDGTAELLVDTDHAISTFGQGVDGEIYYADIGGGRIYKLVPSGGGGGNADPVPDDLAATGCVAAGNPTQPAPGLIPYAINAPFWSDGAVKERYIGLPNGTTISRNGIETGDWSLPPGTVLMKNFRLNNQLIETRLFMRHPDGGWAGYTYEWNAGQTAATRVRGGKTRTVGSQTWIYPSEGDCMRCHTAAADFSLGLETQQLNRNMTYPSTGRTADQLRTLDHIGVFDAPLPGTVTQILADPADTSASLTNRARAYLHVNCAGCHRPAGPTTSSMNLKAQTAFSSTNTCNVVPGTNTLGIPNAMLIAPGDASRSVVIARMGRRDQDGMPPLASSIVDAAGEALLMDWVNSLTNCN